MSLDTCAMCGKENDSGGLNICEKCLHKAVNRPKGSRIRRRILRRWLAGRKG